MSTECRIIIHMIILIVRQATLNKIQQSWFCKMVDILMVLL